MAEKYFASIVHASLIRTPAATLLNAHDAVVLERIAMGAGATNWYYCRDSEHLRLVEAQLSPGSLVSFYFGDQIRNVLYTPAHKAEMERIITQTRDVVLGFLRDDGYRIDVEFIDNTLRLSEATADLAPTHRVFYGAFPARDNDGVRAVTLILPDADGTVRENPN